MSGAALVQAERAHGGEVACADVRGARLLTGGAKALRVWRWRRGVGWALEAERPRAHRYAVTAARWADSGLLAASAGVDGCVRLWTPQLQPRAEVAAPRAAAVRSLCWAPGRLCSGHDDGAVSVWRVEYPGRGPGDNAVVRLEARLEAHSGALHALCAPARGALLMAACTEGVLKVFDMAEVCRRGVVGGAPTPLLWEDGAHDLGALCASVSRCGRRAATGGHDARVRVWHVGRRGVSGGGALVGHGAAVTALAWGARLLASASLDRTARVWRGGLCTRVLHAHPRYLTCVLLAPDESYMITGSNDKTIRMWSLKDLTIEDELEQPYDVNTLFGLGDLEGIGAVDDEQLLSLEEVGGGVRGVRGECAVRAGAAVNCIAAAGDILATALSDGSIHVYRYCTAALQLLHASEAHGYPATAVSLSRDGRVLLSAGLDGTARVWDVETGVQTRLLSVPTARDESDTGGGGVRDARLCTAGSEEGVGGEGDLIELEEMPVRSEARLRALLATDDGLVPVWKLEDDDLAPAYVLEGQGAAAWCCAWGEARASGARVGAAGGERGEVRLFSARAALLHTEHEAHDLGVQSCDFAPTQRCEKILSAKEESDEKKYSFLLATGGCDGLVKLWDIHLYEDSSDERVTMQLIQQLEAHGGGVACVRFQRGVADETSGADGASRAEGESGTLLASGGADRWARVWRVRDNCATLLVAVKHRTSSEEDGEVKECGIGGVTSVCLLENNILAAGTLDGELAIWSLKLEGRGAGVGGGEGKWQRAAGVRCWGARDVESWLQDYITRVPGARASPETEAALLQSARAASLDGEALLDAPMEELLASMLHDLEDKPDPDDGDDKPACVEEDKAAIRSRLEDELEWLRRDPPSAHQEASAPAWARCAASRAVMREAWRAPDGFSYERSALLDAFIANEGEISPVSGRSLRGAGGTGGAGGAGLAPNYKLREQIKRWCRETQQDDTDHE